jgi:hypothetical protein
MYVYVSGSHFRQAMPELPDVDPDEFATKSLVDVSNPFRDAAEVVASPLPLSFVSFPSRSLS